MLNIKSLLTKIVENILPISGGQMTGALKTSFKSAEVIGSKMASSQNIGALATELYGKYQMGSVNITQNYTAGNFIIPNGWYNYISLNDKILLFGMTTGVGIFLIRSANSSTINRVCKVAPLRAIKGNLTAVSNSNYALNGTAGTHYYYVKFGNVVTVNFNVKCTTPNANMTKFASGLPKHNGATQIFFPLANQAAGAYRPMWARIDTDGTVWGCLGGANNQYFYGSICYITYE